MPVLDAPVHDRTIMEAPLAQPDVTIEQEVERLEQLDLPSEDGMPMESNWHRIAMNLLIDSVHALWRDRDDYFVGGNMFIYFSVEQVRRKNYRGPDFFVVNNVDGSRDRESWIVWYEDGRYPDVIIELSSPSTMKTDLTVKKDLYEQTFHTPYYFCYDPERSALQGWHLNDSHYQPLTPNERGWLWCEALQVWLGTWQGEYQRVNAIWPRFYTQDGSLVLTLKEAEAQRAEAEAQRAEAEAQRAEAEAQRAEAETQRAEAETQRAEAEAQRAEVEAQRAEAETQRAERFAAKLRELGINPETL